MKTGFVFLFLFIVSIGLAQTENKSSILLDRYDFGVNGKGGRLFVAGGNSSEKVKYKLTKGNKWFSLTKDHQLIHNKKAILLSKVEIEVEASINKIKTKSKFILLNDQFHRNKIIAHRGAWKNTQLPENSLASLQASFDMGCEGSEFDVHLSADSVVFIHHDANWGPVYIEKSKAADLRQLTLSNGEPLPLLTEYLEKGMRQQTTRLVLELKPSVISRERSLALARKVVEEVRKAHAEAWMIYISFDYAILQEIRRLDPYAKCAYLKGDVSPEKLAADKMYGLDYNAGNLRKNPEWIRQAKQLGLTTNVWTVNDPKAMDHFLKEGIDFITTNEPEIALQKTTLKK